MTAYARVRTLFESHGELQAQPADRWTGPEPLPAEVAAFYAAVGPWGPTIHPQVGPVGINLLPAGMLVSVPPLHKLFALQAGYATVGMAEQRINPDWPCDWLVIAQSNADPFIFHRQTRQVLFAFHGAGHWAPKPFAPDLRTAMAALATLSQSFLNLNHEDDSPDLVDQELTPTAWLKLEADLAALVGGDQALRMIGVLELR